MSAEGTPSPSGDTQPIGRMWVIDLNGSWPRLQPAVPATFARASLEGADALAVAMGLARSDEVRRRLESGRRCYVASVGGEWVAYGWVSFVEEAIGSLDLRVRLLPGEAYIWDCATLPAFRDRGLYSALLTHVLSTLSAEGLRRAWIGADLDNAPSQAGIARAGFTPVVDLVVSGGPQARRLSLQARPGVAESLAADVQRLLLGGPGDQSASSASPAS